MNNKIQFTLSCICIKKNRLDCILASIFPECSRMNIQKWIIHKKIMINNIIVNKPKMKIYLNDHITISISKKKQSIYADENISLKIIYEDQYILIINKPYGLVVHPGYGHTTGTLLDALIKKNESFKKIPRAGIIHRLDKDTTGLMIIAKDVITYIKLKKLIQDRKIIRKYDAFVLGNLIYGGKINVPIIRNKKNGIYMTTSTTGKSSTTYFKIIQKFQYYTHLNIQLKTGRTHQIRVHMLHIKHPILGDPIYCLKNFIPKISYKYFNKINCFHRQALHASHIKFLHPITNIIIDCYAPIPFDMINIIKYL